MIKITLEDDGESVESKLEVNGTSTAELAALYTHLTSIVKEVGADMNEVIAFSQLSLECCRKEDNGTD